MVTYTHENPHTPTHETLLQIHEDKSIAWHRTCVTKYSRMEKRTRILKHLHFIEMKNAATTFKLAHSASSRGLRNISHFSHFVSMCKNSAHSHVSQMHAESADECSAYTHCEQLTSFNDLNSQCHCIISIYVKTICSRFLLICL